MVSMCSTNYSLLMEKTCSKEMGHKDVVNVFVSLHTTVSSHDCNGIVNTACYSFTSTAVPLLYAHVWARAVIFLQYYPLNFFASEVWLVVLTKDIPLPARVSL